MSRLIRESVERVKAMTPQEREGMIAAQRASWIRGEMALSKLVDKTVHPDGSVTYHDYPSYCFD